MSQPNEAALREGYLLEDASAVSTADLVRFVAALLRIAALDGVAPEEGRFVARVAADLRLDGAALQESRALAADAAIPTQALLGEVRDAGLRIALLRDAYRVAALDGTVTSAEIEELRALAAALGVGSETAEVLRAIFAGPSAAPRAAPAMGGEEPRDAGAEALAARIAEAPDRAALARAAREVQELGRRLLAEGTSAPRITRSLVDLNDRLTARVISLEVGGAGLDDLDFCWMALGSEGREEQTFATDQDNGIVFAQAGGDAEAIRARLLPVARRINEGLAECGFPPCKGGVMAGNPAWCASEEEWTRRFARWIDAPEPEALLHATIFFDLRPLWGDRALVGRLQATLARAAPGNARFLLHLARNALGRRPALGFFRDFAVETRGEWAGTIDLKRNGAALFVDAARVYALATGSAGPSTVVRLREAREAAGLPAEEVEAWIDAFHHIQLLRLEHQYALARAGGPVHNHVDPRALNPLGRRFLRAALRQAKEMQGRLERTYGPRPSL